MDSIAPRWAGWTAAFFGLEYAVSKAVMAARGELGGLGHPAPPEAYERFTGDIVVAQLGNAGLGVLGAALALALVHRWGRRVPAALLAAGAIVSLIAGIAGAAVVATSLAGVREDHGQWGVDALVLGVAPLGAWVVLTIAAVRAVRLPAWLRSVPRASAAAAAGCVAYGALKLSWALGGELLMRETPLSASAIRDMLAREPGTVLSHWAGLALALAGVAVALGARHPAMPRPLRVWLPAAIGGLMVLRASYGAASDIAVLTGVLDGAARTARWDLLLWSPFFGAWGAAWLRTVSSIRLGTSLGSGLSPRRTQETA